MKHIVNLDRWERKESYLFFKDFFNPCINVTCNIDAASAKTQAKKNGESFFLYYLYAILKAVNNIPEFKYRIDKEKNVVYYDTINVLTPIKLPHMNTFKTMLFPYHENFAEFYHAAKAKMQASTANVFGEEQAISEYNVVLVSAIPDLAFTSMSAAQCNYTNNYPLFTVGKMQKGKMPLASCVFHGFVDGEHLAEFYRMVDEYLAKF